MDKDLLGLRDLPKERIEEILHIAKHMKNLLKQGVKKLPNLQGKSVITLFYENSTRTRLSFELASKYMSSVAVNISVAASSVSKGETLVDTGKTLDAMQADVIVIRHPMSGAPKLLAKNIKASVINAGDGTNEHPTQALLDMFTMLEKHNTLKGLKVAILGDIKHSRVAKSNLFGLKKLGADVFVHSPATLMLPEIERLGGIRAKSREEAIRDADVVMGLRIQLERQHHGLFPSNREYSKFYGLGEEDLVNAKKDVMIMHPGPVNRGVELTSPLIDADNSYIEEQVLNGIAVRMAILSLLTKK